MPRNTVSTRTKMNDGAKLAIRSSSAIVGILKPCESDGDVLAAARDLQAKVADFIAVCEQEGDKQGKRFPHAPDHTPISQAIGYIMDGRKKCPVAN